MTYVAGLDIGATHVRGAIADGSGAIVAQVSLDTPQTDVGIEVTERVLATLRAVAGEAGLDPTDVAAVGIGSIGPLDLTDGVLENPANLPSGIERIPLVGPVRNAIGSDRVYLRNDATTGVVGERFYGDRTPDNMVYLTISSGIGAGVIVDGTLVRGWDGNAAEVGHMVVDPEGRRTCGCGRPGHWEAYASGDNIPAYTRDLADRLDVSTDLPLTDPDFSAADVYDATDDPLATRVRERVTRWNVIGVANVVHAYAPFVVAIGGSVALNNPATVVEPLVERVPDRLMINVPEIRQTSFGDDVVLRGAVALALTNAGIAE
ncbi:MAG: ROK family protein [Halanaeroarchaeum sp.]